MKVTVKLNFDPKDWSDAVEEAGAKALEHVTQEAEKVWIQQAQEQLHSTQRQYIESISSKIVSNTQAEVILHNSDEKKNFIAIALELGIPSFDLRAPRLAGKAASHYSSYSTRAGQPKPNPPWVRIPMFPKGEGKESGKPDRYPMMTPTNGGKANWIHPGFQPEGSGGLAKPLREAVIEYIQGDGAEYIGKAVIDAINGK